MTELDITGLCEVARWNDVLLGLIIANGNSAAMPAAPLGAGISLNWQSFPDQESMGSSPIARPASQGEQYA